MALDKDEQLYGYVPDRGPFGRWVLDKQAKLHEHLDRLHKHESPLMRLAGTLLMILYVLGFLAILIAPFWIFGVAPSDP